VVRLIAGGIALRAAGAGAQSAAPPPTRTADSVLIACVTSHLAVTPFDTVELRAIAEPRNGAPGWRPSAFSWTLPGGRRLGDGPRVRWLPEGLGLGPYDVAAVVRDAAGMRGRCEVRVLVIEPSGHMGGVMQARAQLLPNAAEEAGYGLYSYLLLPAVPAPDDDRARARLALDAWARMTRELAEFRVAPQERAAVNVNYIPLRRAVAATEAGAASADSLLAAYDHARAQRLLRRLPGVRVDGVYLVSVPRRPLTAVNGEVSGPFIVQDLSHVPITVVQSWVRYFLALAAQERFGEGLAFRRLVLQTRTAVGVAAIGLPQVGHSIADWRERWASWVTTKP
jgi:hypothetical protein